MKKIRLIAPSLLILTLLILLVGTWNSCEKKMAELEARTSTLKNNIEQLKMDIENLKQENESIKKDAEMEIAFLSRTQQAGLDDNQILTLFNLGMTKEDVVKMTSEELKSLLAPGAQLDGQPAVELSDEQLQNLTAHGIRKEYTSVLINLGYSYEDMKALTQTDLDFIFPTTQLISKLVEKGYCEENIKTRGALLENGYENYKQLIDEALK